MPRYAAYCLSIDSDIALPELRAAEPFDERDPDVVINQRAVDIEGSDRYRCGRFYFDATDRVYGTFEIGQFLILRGREIVVQPAVDADSDRLGMYLISMIPILLHQRGYLVLHASVVSVEDTAVAFLGRSGTGKSTLAAAFFREGHSILSDDVAAVDLSGDSPSVAPGFPSIKLESEVESALDLSLDGVRPETSASDERFFRVPWEDRADPEPLRCVYLVRDSSRTKIEPLSPRDQFMALVRHTYSATFLESDREQATHFRQCSRVADSVPVKRLSRPKGYDSLRETVAAVTADLTETHV